MTSDIRVSAVRATVLFLFKFVILIDETQNRCSNKFKNFGIPFRNSAHRNFPVSQEGLEKMGQRRRAYLLKFLNAG